MKQTITVIAALLLGVILLAGCGHARNSNCGGCCNGGSGEKNTPAAQAAYVCPMHPQITSNQPGKCTICGMDLVKQ